jgi:polyketide cyclase/dehydrase/lipid transport protein
MTPAPSLAVPHGGFELDLDLEVGRAPGDVFAFLTSAEGLRAVDPALVDYGPPGPLTAGGAGWFRHRRGGMTANTTWRVTAFEAPTRLEVAISGMGYAMTESAELEATPMGTRARFVDRVWPTSLPGRLLVALSGGIMRRDLRARSERLKTILEAGAPPAA